jgi:hypothetical protein
MLSSEWGSTLVSLAWKPKATPQGRLLFQLAVSELSTEETAASLLGTTTVNDGKNSITESQRGRNTVTAGLLPTWAGTNAQGTPDWGGSHARRKAKKLIPELMPTPNACDHKGATKLKSCKEWNSRGTNLPEYALKQTFLATPAAADCQGSHGGRQGRSLRTDIHNHKRTTGETGLLNPYFVEMMMGFPQGWTLDHEPHDCEH